MTSITTNEIRTKFIEFFTSNDHRQLPSSSLIPHNDPTLMFVNSGMVQFKNHFTGREISDYDKAVTAQKCVRAGGKHNDLDNVGYTARHHTFFEMLGNFSFGAYFKEQAIYYAWQLLTKEFGIAAEKLYVTIYHNDEEAASFWRKISGFGDDKIIKIITNDNFWSAGDTGPCGPCSEIFYDHGEHIFGGLPGTEHQDGDRYIEIWNMVFMQYDQLNKDQRILLPKPAIDTGMGLERISAVLQGVHDNYDTDIFKELIHASETLTSVVAQNNAKFSHRVIADHLRSAAFLIADGVMPSNEGRGYVLRRIMRRAMRHAHLLGAKEPLLYKLLPTFVSGMKDAYPELKRAEDFTKNIFKNEEEKFKITLEKGLKLLDEETKNLTIGSRLSGEVAFKLYDTYGFPLDLTADILKNKKIDIDNVGFKVNMQKQKQLAKQAWIGSGETITNNVWFDINQKFGNTEFLGYSVTQNEGQILVLLQHNQHVNTINNQEIFTLIATQTPFYGESGGQMGDIGIIFNDHCQIKVLDTKKYLNVHAHSCKLEQGQINVNDFVTLKIDLTHRNNLKIHHSATHILHAVLRDILGTHVTQKGSLVAENKLRFDFAQPIALSHSQLQQIEEKVNEVIRHNSEITTEILPATEAISKGAMALFGEKYDSEVRVVSMGYINSQQIYSYELCGGTHAMRTGDIGIFKIISESSIAAGIRRIEAVCGMAALQYLQNNEYILASLANCLKTTKDNLSVKVEQLVVEKKILEKKINELQQASLKITSQELIQDAETYGEVNLFFKAYNNIETKDLRAVAEIAAGQFAKGVVILTSRLDTKLLMLIAVNNQINKHISAVEIAELAINILNGSGGGKPNLAQISSTHPDKLPIFKQKLIEFIITK